MKICYVSASRLPSRTANSVQVTAVCSALASLGHEVVLYFIKGPLPGDPHRYYGIPSSVRLIETNACSIPLIGGMVRALRVFSELESADLYYTRDPYLALLLSLSRKAFILELHAVHPRSLVRHLIVRALCSRSCRGGVCISASLKEDYESLYPRLRWARLIVAHDGAPSALSDLVPRESSGPPRCGYIGSLYQGKGVDVLLAVSQKLPQVKFDVFGGGHEEVARLSAGATYPNVVFYGHISREKLPSALERFNIALLPNQPVVRLEGGKGDIGRWTSPLKLFEYMASGKAIIASDLPVLREVLLDRVNALLVPADDPNAWVAAIVELTENPTLRTSLGRRAQEDFKQQYSWEIRMSKVLHEVAA